MEKTQTISNKWNLTRKRDVKRRDPETKLQSAGYRSCGSGAEVGARYEVCGGCETGPPPLSTELVTSGCGSDLDGLPVVITIRSTGNKLFDCKGHKVSGCDLHVVSLTVQWFVD